MGEGLNAGDKFGQTRIYGRELRTKAEQAGDDLVLDNGESVEVWARDGVVYVGCVRITEAAWKSLQNKIVQMRAFR